MSEDERDEQVDPSDPVDPADRDDGPGEPQPWAKALPGDEPDGEDD